MTACGRSWRNLGPAGKSPWRAAAKRLSLPCSGYNLWVSWRWKQDEKKIETVQNQSGYILPTSASTATAFDEVYKPRPTRPSKITPNPWIFIMPRAAVVGVEKTTILWYMPWHTDYPYASPVPTYLALGGVGSMASVPSRNKILVPIYYTAPAAEGDATIRITCCWPDNTWHVSGFDIHTTNSLS
jgi:hypothetical protein